MKSYYVVVPGGNAEGPFDEQTIKQGIANGTYPSSASVFCEGMADWEPITAHFPAPESTSVDPTPEPMPTTPAVESTPADPTPEAMPAAPAPAPAAVAPASPKKKEESADDPLETVAAAAAIVDTVDDIAGDGDSDLSTVIMGLSVAGIVLSYLAITHNPGNGGVILGVVIFMIGYLVLLSGLLAIYMVVGSLVGLYMNLFEDGDIPYSYIFGAMGGGALIFWIRSLIPGDIMRTMQKISWLAMFAGPGLMIASGANITGTLNIIVSVIWLIFFLIGMTVNYAAKKVGNAIDSALTGKSKAKTPVGAAAGQGAHKGAAPVRRLTPAAPVRRLKPVVPANSSTPPSASTPE